MANPLLMASAWPRSGSDMNVIRSSHAASARTTSSELSFEAPSTTMTSSARTVWWRTDSMHVLKNRPEFRLGTMTETSRRTGIVDGGQINMAWRSATGEDPAGPLVSIVTPCLDAGPARLRRCLASVADPTYRRVEHIVVDGGPTDSSLAAP